MLWRWILLPRLLLLLLRLLLLRLLLLRLLLCWRGLLPRRRLRGWRIPCLGWRLLLCRHPEVLV